MLIKKCVLASYTTQNQNVVSIRCSNSIDEYLLLSNTFRFKIFLLLTSVFDSAVMLLIAGAS